MKLILKLTVATLVAVLFTACGNGSSTSAPAATATPPVATATPPVATATPPAATATPVVPATGQIDSILPNF